MSEPGEVFPEMCAFPSPAVQGRGPACLDVSPGGHAEPGHPIISALLSKGGRENHGAGNVRPGPDCNVFPERVYGWTPAPALSLAPVALCWRWVFNVQTTQGTRERVAGCRRGPAWRAELALTPAVPRRPCSHAQHGPAVAAAQACGMTTCVWQARDTG